MREKRQFVCQECGQESPKWLGRCPGCGGWNSLVEEMVSPAAHAAAVQAGEPQPLSSVAEDTLPRAGTGLGELDRVLGGGVVPGSLVLVGGDPGIGKSTLLLQAAHGLAMGGPVLYVSAEESLAQTASRARRLGLSGSGLYLAAESDLEAILQQVERLHPCMAVVDSIQTVYLGELGAAPGSVTQVRECAGRLLRLAKTQGVPVFLVGHVTKEGSLAGPRVLEHMVDTVLYFEGERHQSYRILRAVKNRYGSTNEIGVFQMAGDGLHEVQNPSQLFLAQRPAGVPGSVVVASLEGTRPILLEVQALVGGSAYSPRRLATGLDLNRVNLMVAVLEKKVGLHLSSQDVFLNVAGGLTVLEPAVDLGICAALASSHRDIPIYQQAAVMGEVGLAGEVRSISQVERRVAEAARLGFTRLVLPAGSMETALPEEVTAIPVRSVEEALEALLEG